MAEGVLNRNDSHDLIVPWHLLDDHLEDDEDTEQHKKNRRGKSTYKRSIKHYGHATSKWGAALESFTPLWFAISISSGGLGLVLNGPFPYRGHWMVVIATILYLVDIVTFLLFMAMTIARWVVFPHVAVRRLLSDPDELCMYAIPPIALMTIGALTAMQVSNSWGGHSFTIVAYVLWWIAVLWSFLTVLLVFTVLIYTGNQVDRCMTPLLFMAPVGLATAGTEAGYITVNAHDMSSRLAVPQIIVGYFAAGVALFMAIILYTIYLHRLLAAGWAAPRKRPGIFVLVGSCGQLSTAFQLLGKSADAYGRFSSYKPQSVKPPSQGTFWQSSTASGIDDAGIFTALLLLGFDYFWLCIALIGIADVFIKRQATYSLSWWAVVFPNVILTSAGLALGSAMDSPAFKVLTAAMTVIVAIIYLVNWAFTIRGIVDGSLIFCQSQLELEENLIKKADKEKNKELDNA